MALSDAPGAALSQAKLGVTRALISLDVVRPLVKAESLEGEFDMRAISIAYTHLEEAEMWLGKADEGKKASRG
jgi:hypothetical protein